MIDPRLGHLGLFTDLYELTMLQAYVAEGMAEKSVFTLFVRRLPPHRNFLIACGLDPVLALLEQLRFTDDDVEYLRSLRLFSSQFLSWLQAFRFTGDVHAVAEGTPLFANEPIMEVVAPLAEAQLVETLVMNQMHVQTLLASKAARVVAAARGRSVVDFGARRTPGIDAANLGARAFYIAGLDATSNVLAGKLYGIPVSGTMAHSYIQAHGDERSAFRAFAGAFPGTTLLVDTYDTLQGVRHAIELVRDGEIHLGAIRLDSGDLALLTREARRLLDEAGLRNIRIIASGGLDEYRITELLARGAPVDGFGVGTAMSVSEDAPSLDVVYKLAEYAGRGRTKRSAHKGILPGRKQVFRLDAEAVASHDVIAMADERLPGRPLLQPVMRAGKRIAAMTHGLAAIRSHAAAEVARLPPRLMSLDRADPPYRVEVSPTLQAHHGRVRHELAG